jgi:DNA anti-recombination protein RmuC
MIFVPSNTTLSQKATDIANAITTAASSSLSSAQSRVHSLSDSMVDELQKLQASTSQLAASFQSGVQDSASHMHHAYAEITGALSDTVRGLTSIIKEKDVPVQDKVSRISKEVQNRVKPLLDTLKKAVSEALARSKEASPSGGTNGHATSNGE